MKSFLALALVSAFSLTIFSTLSALATQTDPTVTVTSFARVGDVNSQVAEVCGNVKNAVGLVQLDVIADYETKNSGEYHTTIGTSGNFCQLIRTFYGRVQVNAEVEKVNLSTTAIIK
jgi:lipopolysaccharide export system protein LptA